MDPDDTLRRLRELAKEAIKDVESGYEFDSGQVELAELFQALDEWLSRGGFLPAAWRKEAPKPG